VNQHDYELIHDSRHAYVKKTINVLDRISLLCAGVLFSGVVIIVSAAVILRYLFSVSFMWSTELSQFLMVWMVLMGAAAAQRRGEHLRIDFIVPKLPKHIQRILVLLQKTAVTAVSLFMVIWGIKHAWGAWRLTTLGLKLPKAVVLLAVPAGMGLFLCLYLLQLSAGRKKAHQGRGGSC